MKYIIASGWWSCESNEDNRKKLFGDDDIRDVEFHQLWRDCINRFTAPREIMVIDSASPKKPVDISGEKWISMTKNFGHSTSHDGPYSGYTRAIFLSMMYAYVNDFDYWVYVEQDALIYGDRIIERSIEKSKHGVVFGSGQGTPQEIQQSLMIFKRERILPFIKNYVAIREDDKVISPEWKFLIAENYIARRLPTKFLKWLTTSSPYRRIQSSKRLACKILRAFDQFDLFDFGFGRSRPIDFSANYFYFQHASKEELSYFKDKMSLNSNR